MKLRELAISGVVEVTPTRHDDQRGYFSETFRDDWFSQNVADVTFVQENHSFSHARGIVRGLHCQTAPSEQGKLVRCLSGAVLDVAVDIRYGSPGFGKFATAVLSADECNQLWIPAGFLHGICSLTANTLVSYKVTSYYDAAADRGVVWNDAQIGIRWPDFVNQSLLSSKDQNHPTLAELPEYFSYSEAAL